MHGLVGARRYVAWVTAAFGPFWGFQEGWWSWLSGVTDNSVYPVLFLTYLDAVLPGAQCMCLIRLLCQPQTTQGGLNCSCAPCIDSMLRWWVAEQHFAC